MPVVARTNDSLHLYDLGRGGFGTWASFDRARQRAEIISFAVLVPFRRQILHLAEIAGAQVRKRENPNGKAKYSVILRRKIGENVHLRCRSRETAMEMMGSISEFLESK